MLFLIFSALLFYFLIHQFWLRRRNLPDGPLPLPIIGNIHQFAFAKRYEHQLLKWKEKYGPIFTVWLGLSPSIMVADYETCVKLFVHNADAFIDRPAFKEFMKRFRGGTYGVTFVSGPCWQEQRRAVLKILRDFGMGKNKIQESILDEVQTICDGINSEIEAGIVEHNIHKFTDIAAGSLINSILSGYRYTTDNRQSEFYRLKSLLNKLAEYIFHPLTVLSMHSDFVMRSGLTGWWMNRLDKPMHEIMEYIDGVIKEHTIANDYFDPSFEPRDFIDAYQVEMIKAEKSGTSHYFSDLQCKHLVLDLWLAGQQTTSSTIQWAIAYFICYQDVQKKIQAELDSVIGGDRWITIEDRVNLPYLNASIIEMQRCVNLLAVNFPHCLTRDFNLNGVNVKKGTKVIALISVIMCDPKNFPEPDKFKPERFIDSENKLVNYEKVIPFSLGKRQCLGEGLARMELFLVLANMLNQFKFTAASKPPSLKRRYDGGSPQCEVYDCCVEKRF